MDFWCHVVKSTKACMKIATTIFALNWSRKTEVSNLQLIVLVEQEIFWFQISVSYSFSVAMIETIHELFEEVSCELFLEAS